MSNKEPLLFPTPTALWRPMEGNVRLLRAKVLAGEMTEEEATAIIGKSPMEQQGKVQAYTGEPVLSPTPTAQDWKVRGPNSHQQGLADVMRRHNKELPSSAEKKEALLLWHTPSAQEPGIKNRPLVAKDGTPARVGARVYDAETGRLVQMGLTQQIMLTSSPGVSPANPSARQESAEERRMLVTSGRKCCALLRSFTPLGLLARMLLASWTWDLNCAR